MKITQKGVTITADFTELKSQFSNNAIKIPVDFTDTEFNGYSMFYSVKIINFATYNYIAGLVNGSIVLPSACTYYGGTITISLYGILGDITKTTNNIPFTVVESNPTGTQVPPISTDWVELMRSYADSIVAQLGVETQPSINGNTFNWWIGSTDTGVRAKGDVVTIRNSDYHWLINGVDTGVIAMGRTDTAPATSALAGVVRIGEGINVATDGLISVPALIKDYISIADVPISSWRYAEVPPYKEYSYFAKIAVSGVTSNDIAEVVLGSYTSSDSSIIDYANEGIIYHANDTIDGFVVLYANEIPTTPVPITRISIRRANV